MDQNTIPTKVVNDIATLKRLGWLHETIRIHILQTAGEYDWEGQTPSSELLDPFIFPPPLPKPVKVAKPRPPKLLA